MSSSTLLSSSAHSRPFARTCSAAQRVTIAAIVCSFRQQTSLPSLPPSHPHPRAHPSARSSNISLPLPSPPPPTHAKQLITMTDDDESIILSSMIAMTPSTSRTPTSGGEHSTSRFSRLGYTSASASYTATLHVAQTTTVSTHTLTMIEGRHMMIMSILQKLMKQRQFVVCNERSLTIFDSEKAYRKRRRAKWIVDLTHVFGVTMRVRLFHLCKLVMRLVFFLEQQVVASLRQCCQS